MVSGPCNTTTKAILISNGNYRNLWLGGTISLLGDHLNHVASTFLVSIISHKAGSAIGILMGIRAVARIIGGNLGGVLADRYDKRHVLITLDIIMGVTTASYIIAVNFKSVEALYILAGIMGCLSAIFSTVRTSFIPDLVYTNSLTQAFGLNQLSLGLAMTWGNLMGGTLVGWWGCEIAFIVDSMTFLLSALCTWSIKPQNNFTFLKKPLTPLKLYSEFIEGAKYISRNTFILRMIVLDLFWALGGGGVFVIMTMVNHERFDNSAQMLGLIYAMAGVGALLANLGCPWFGKSERRDLILLGFSCLIEGVLFITIMLLSRPELVIPLFGVQMTVSFAFGLIYGPLFIKSISDEFRGRVLGFEEGLFLPIYGLSSMVYGLLLDTIGTLLTGIISGGVMACVGIVWVLVTVKKPIASGR